MAGKAQRRKWRETSVRRKKFAAYLFVLSIVLRKNGSINGNGKRKRKSDDKASNTKMMKEQKRIVLMRFLSMAESDSRNFHSGLSKEFTAAKCDTDAAMRELEKETTQRPTMANSKTADFSEKWCCRRRSFAAPTVLRCQRRTKHSPLRG
jgi:hypothetical protein